MEIIRRDTDYAIRGLVHLASVNADMTSCGQLAEATGIPKSFAHKILKRLADAGLIFSSTGRTGGFRLSKDPKRIALRDVVEAVQGPVSVSRCVTDPAACGNSSTCPLSKKWRKLQDALSQFLTDTTLDDILRSMKPSGGKSK